MNQDKIYEHLGAVIKRRRKQLEMKQRQLAGLLRISRGSLANIETGRQGVLVHQLYKFADALGLEPADFLISASPKSNLLRASWTDAIPTDLKPQQREQIARLLGSNQQETTAPKESKNGKPAKKRAANSG